MTARGGARRMESEWRELSERATR